MIRSTTFRALAVAAVFFCGAGCRHTTGESTSLRGIDVEGGSIAVSQALRGRKVERLKIMPNTSIPKGVAMSLTTVTKDVVAEVYEIIHRINVGQNLRGHTGSSQEITLIAVTPEESLYQQLAADLRRKLNLAGSTPLPYLQKIVAPVDLDIWMQDWGEFASAQVEGHAVPVHAILDTGRGFLYSSKTVEVFASTLGIPFIRIPLQGAARAGSYGGNIEATPDGRIVMGDASVDDEVISFLTRMTGQDPIRVPTGWLQTRHVDEYLSFLPAPASPCGSVLLLGSPLEGLQILAGAGAQEAKRAALPDPEAVQNSLRYFADGNLDKPLRGAFWEVDMIVRSNLRAENAIRNAEAILRSTSHFCMPRVVRVPQLYYRDASQDEGGGTSPQLEQQALEAAETFTQMASLIPNAMNLLVLRDHVVVSLQRFNPKIETFKPFEKIITARLADVLGGPEKVHFVDTHPYGFRGGGIHCGTNVIREIITD